MAPGGSAVPAHAGSGLGTLGLAALFTLFLVPIQVDGFGYNYTFLLLPIALVLAAGRACRPASLFPPIIGLYFLVMLVASIYQFDYYDEMQRRFISFVLFMAGFSYLFVNVDERMIRAFKIALVAASLLFSLHTAVLFFTAGGGVASGYEAKNIVGSQRLGFLYLMAFWILLMKPTRGWVTALRFGSILLIVCGLVLTFSRASIIGLLVSLAGFAGHQGALWLRRPTFSGLIRGIGAVLLIAIGGGVLLAMVPLVFDFFAQHLFAYVADNAAVQKDLGNMYSTGGTRVYLWQQILAYSAANPLTGSGFLGVWVLPGLGGDFVSSAHSQYGDVLFRTGIAGIAVYLFLLLLLWLFLFERHRSLFWGFVAVLVYGCLHETFKEAHGCFIFAFLLGMLSQHLKQRARPRRDPAGAARP
jgi:O-antigen ligase